MTSFQTRVCFVVPTYNEALNVTSLLQRLTELYPSPDVTFLIVDDESPDGTGRLVRAFAATDDRVRLLEGKRRGFGQAYVRGMTYALDVLSPDVVVQMDADFSHDPADAGKLLARLADGADVVIGSRYVSGGAVDRRWHVGRRLLSRWGNRFARLIAGMKVVCDCTAGFKAIKATALRAAKVEEIRVIGHTFQVVLLHRLILTGAKVIEEPIYFRDRDRGRTKLGVGSILEFFYNVWWLYVASHWTFVKFVVTGLTGILVNLGSFFLLIKLGMHKFLASPVAIELSIISNFLINNYWSFADRVMIDHARTRIMKYNLVALSTLVLSYVTFIVLSFLFSEASPVLLQGCGILPAGFLNYFMNSSWTFRETDRDGPR